MIYPLAQLNQMDCNSFVEALGTVFEDTPKIAELAWQKRPFSEVSDLHQKMADIVSQMSLEDRLALIRSHPDLGSKLKMADASVREQKGAGLDRLTAAESEYWLSLNRAYREKFAMPFIIAVKNHTKESILAVFERSLVNSLAAEQERAIAEICEIARLRLLERVKT